MHFPGGHSPLKKLSDVAFRYKDIYSFQKSPLQLFPVLSSTVQQTSKNIHKFHLCFQTAFCHDPAEGLVPQGCAGVSYGPLFGWREILPLPHLQGSPRLLHNALSAQAIADARNVDLATLTSSRAPS